MTGRAADGLLRIIVNILKGLPIRLPKIESHNIHIFHQYVIATSQRDELIQYLKQQGIETAVYYPLSFIYKSVLSIWGIKKVIYRSPKRLQRETLALPIFLR